MPRCLPGLDCGKGVDALCCVVPFAIGTLTLADEVYAGLTPPADSNLKVRLV